MTDSLKLAEMQRTNIEFERQRHLANWFIKSSPHMPTPSLDPNGGGGGGICGVTTSAQEGHKPKLRRFNSHDTSANMFSVADFENARLVRRNEIEMKQRQQQRLKMNSLSSGGDCSTGDSKGSKYSNDSQPEPLPAETFLERYPPPRVVFVSYKPKFSHETLQSSSSNGSSSTNSLTSTTNKNPTGGTNKLGSGDLYLIYRYISERKIYHGYNSKSGANSRKKGVMLPQEFPGFFSLVNDKGSPTATLYTTFVQLVRERVFKFISVDNLPAFTESRTNDTFPPRSHYVKSTARGGQVFRLLAVFEDGKQDSSSSSNKNSSGREKEKGRYAQLLNENRQILYVSLTTKGKFYEIEPGIPQILQKTGMVKETERKLNPDCVHRISDLLKNEREYPVNIRYIAGPTNVTNKIPEHLTITNVSTENVLIACPIEDVEARSELHLKKLPVTSDMTLMKCFLGFENEQRMFSNQNIQNILKFCQFDFDSFTKQIESETLVRPERTSSKSRVEGLKILKPLKLLRREKTSIAHEKEDSIIFLSKNDLANLEAREESKEGQSRITEKMKVFQPTKKKWFKKNEKHTSLNSLDLDEQAKRMSMERYNDMSKLLQERFGDTLDEASHERPTSDLGRPDKPRTQIQKSLSLQEVDFVEKPDLVPENYSERNGADSQLELNDDRDTIDTDLTQSHTHQQQSFISEKMYSEFHVKTRQYSKSSSSLHQLLHFAVPSRMNIVETKKHQLLAKSGSSKDPFKDRAESNNKKLDFILNEKVDDANLRSSTTIIDDLPYSSVRDSLLPDDSTLDLEDDGDFAASNGDLQIGSKRQSLIGSDIDAKENIYAEICNDGGAVSRIQITCCYVSPQQSSDLSTTLSSLASGGGYAELQTQTQSDDGASTQNIYNTIK
ncbi:unnamed protein product [Hermetia illucens]|uniref:CABIT domain-containing protein n=1 Tax=Hermetia illucens TaxID=343691 RepID=A0A7R8USM2_HERIL|nr:uncharacterized protein LOC119650581 isoform X2 [Hermetia illucens]CAD7086262.1 unnamed protein product [Hermetia illucens]